MITLKGLTERRYEWASVKVDPSWQAHTLDLIRDLKCDLQWWWIDWGGFIIMVPLMWLYWTGIFWIGYAIWSVMYLAHELLNGGALS